MKKLLALILSVLVLMTSLPALGVFAASEEGGHGVCRGRDRSDCHREHHAVV